jgi:hypothetical protein
MRLSALFAMALLATGCVAGGFDPAGPGDDGGDDGTDDPAPAGEAEAQYRTNVHPVMVAKCGTSGCHAQANATGVYGFAIPDAADSYAQLVSVPTLVGTYTAQTAGLITKIEQVGGHNAVAYTADEETKITSWLAAELAEREDSGTVIIDPNEVLRTWSGCMSLENFEASEPPMASAWGQLGSNDTNQRCANCHQAGLYTFLTGNGNNAEQFFTGLTTQKDFLLKYFTVDGTGKVIINEASMTNAGVTLAAHPRFNPTINNGMTALRSFYDLTVARQTAATCDPPRLPL